ncbi:MULTISPECIES: hypothetical protein [unclassified Streptomyces]|uniref:hypothetical protein n=1 Tax=unclassified Streptomyces TaxID=2593676 RepID=UPI0033309E3A
MIDMITTYDHEDAELLPAAEPGRSHPGGYDPPGRDTETPVIYANDNFGRSRSHHGELGELVDFALSRPHSDMVEPIRPDDDSLFVVKPGTRSSTKRPCPICCGSWAPPRWSCRSGQVTEECVTRPWTRTSSGTWRSWCREGCRRLDANA